MTQEAAIYEARKRINKQPKDSRNGFYIVWSPESYDIPTHHYHLATEEDLDTFFAGAEVTCYVEPDGSIS